MEIAKPVRRIVTAQDENEKPMVLFDGPTPDVRTDPARPGYASAQIWATDRTPARIKGVKETLPLSRIIEPPKNGSVFRVVTFPPDASYLHRSDPRRSRHSSSQWALPVPRPMQTMRRIPTGKGLQPSISVSSWRAISHSFWTQRRFT